MSVFPRHADTLLRLARSLSSKNDSGDLAKISLSKFYWRGKDAHTAEYDEKKLYGLVGVGAYIVMCGDDRAGYLEEFLGIIADIPCIVNEPIFGMHDIVNTEKICFCIGLILTDIYNLFPVYQTQVLTTVASIFSSYHKILIKNEDEANISMVSIPGLFGILRSLFRISNSVKRLIPLQISSKRTEENAEEVNLAHFFSYPERQLPLEEFNVKEEKSLVVATMGLYDYFASVSNDVNDLGIIQLSHFFTRCTASLSDQEEFTKMSKKVLDGYISSVNAIRQDNDDSSNLKLSRIQRQLHCISASCFLSVRTVKSEESATGILKKIVARLLGNDPTALCLIAVGLFHDLLSAVSELTSYHPSIKDQAVKAIRDFLLTPAQVLVKLKKTSKKGEYLQLREHAIRTFKDICSCGENNENEQVGILCSKILSISINNASGSLAMDHLFALLTTFVTEKSDSQLKVFTTIHNTHSMKSGLNLEKECILHLTDLSIKIAEKSPPEDSKGENMAAEIIEIIIQSYVNSKITSVTALACLEKLAANASGHHKLWLLSRYLKVFFLFSTEDKTDDRIAPVMACIAKILSKNAPDWNDPQVSSLRNSMRDFWFYCAVFGFSDMSIGWPEKFRTNIMVIAKRSPTLSFLANEPVKQTLENNPALKKGSAGSSIKEVQDLKLALSHSIGSRDMQLDGEIKSLDYVNVLYHIAVLHIERLRLASYLASDPKGYEYQELFTYIENQMVQRSKQAKDKILKEILITIYREYLSAIRDFAQTVNIDTCLVEKVQLLLIKFNSTNSTSRYIADSNLLVTFNYFEHLVWQPAIIETELDIVQQLSFSLEDAEDSFQEAHELSIPSVNISLKLPDSLEKRQSMVLAMQRYLLEKPGILRRALDKAPRATRSHIAEYLRSKDEKDHEVHANTHLLFSSARITAKDLNFSKRSKFFGEAALLVDIVQDPVSEIISKYDKVNLSDKGKNRHKLEDHMYKMAALILLKESISEESKRKLLRKISWAIIDTFHVQIVEAAIYCWQWISSARPEMDEVIMLEIASVWQCTIEKNLGIFEPAHSEGNVLAFLESDPPCPNPPNIAPHMAWVRYLQETLSSFKLTKTGPCRTILSLLNCTLSSSVAGSADHIITRHVNSAAVRMELISLGFSILHSQVLIREVERSVLRAKLYNSLFDYFSTPSSLPVMPKAQLKEDIDALIRFVQVMNKEGKRIADPLAGVAGVSYSTTGSTKDSMSGTESLRRGDMTSSAGSTLTPKSAVVPNGVRHLVDNYKRKRQFALQLLVLEIERFKIWLQPQPQHDENDRFMQFADIFSLDKLVDKQWKQLAKDGWSISPYLACQLPSRLKQEPALIQELIHLVQRNPQIAHEIPEAVSFFITPEFIRSDGKDISYLLFWKSTDPATALGLFSQRLSPHSYTAQYAVRCLRSFQEEQILFYIPQLVQALRYDSIGYVAEYLLAASRRSPLLAHQLLWNMKVFSHKK